MMTLSYFYVGVLEPSDSQKGGFQRMVLKDSKLRNHMNYKVLFFRFRNNK